MLYLVAFLTAFIIGHFYFESNLRTLYLKKLMLPCVCIVFLLCLILFSKTAFTAASKGLNLWLEIVVPSLFPFFITSELLKKSGFVRSAGILLEPLMRPLFNIPGTGSFAFLMGIISGYPVGAKITSDLYRDKLLTSEEAERLLAFSNNSGPLFIIGAVSVGMFKMPSLGLVFFVCHLAAGITVGMIYKLYFRERKKNSRRKKPGCNVNNSNINTDGKNAFSRFKTEVLKSGNSSLGNLLGSAITNSVQTILMIGGFIIFFSVLINLLLEIGVIASISGILSIFLSSFGIDTDLLNAILSGFIEITTGTSLISSLMNTPFYLKLMATSFIIGWAGLSVHAQVLSIVYDMGLSVKPYLIGKLMQGFIAALYTLIIYKAAGHEILGSKEAFFHVTSTIYSQWYDYLFYSLTVTAIMFGIFFILSVAGKIFQLTCIKKY